VEKAQVGGQRLRTGDFLTGGVVTKISELSLLKLILSAIEGRTPLIDRLSPVCLPKKGDG